MDSLKVFQIIKFKRNLKKVIMNFCLRYLNDS
jgi:hypothetical protein